MGLNQAWGSLPHMAQAKVREFNIVDLNMDNAAIKDLSVVYKDFGNDDGSHIAVFAPIALHATRSCIASTADMKRRRMLRCCLCSG